MRHSIRIILCATGAVVLSACAPTPGEEVDRALRDINVIDESNLNEVMLQSSDPAEAVAYFQRATANDPDRIDLMRGLGKSLVRAGRATEAVTAWENVTNHPDAADADSVALADALIRNNEWNRAAEVLDAVPPTVETYNRYRLEAMIADSENDWDKADSFYQTAVGLTTKPGPVLNNWGYSKLTRGDAAGAERLFADAVRQAPGLFTAKNNLVLARGTQGNYAMPVLPATQEERAQLLYTLGLAAVKQGDVAIGRGLLQEAVETHPQHFDAAVRSLRALESGKG
ncbi:tetratricopeptide repeat protein [Roseovarius nitratireducens]|uniref:tetratricopeptide repeat protein n=1 Tax=Roseovarius nitratireducens TaxID=2044597 RepID=UPI000CE27C17|nr:tetratricopeptide repeat protein [Roseovarius nitratireducens]